MKYELQELAASVIFNAQLNNSRTKEELMEHGLARNANEIAEIEKRTKERVLQASSGDLGAEIIWTKLAGYHVACVLDLFDCEHCWTYQNRNSWFHCLETALKKWKKECF